MIDNPFLEAIAYTASSDLTARLCSAAVMWDLLTKNETPNDEMLCQILISWHFDDLWYLYRFQKQNSEAFDRNQFELLIKVWTAMQDR